MTCFPELPEQFAKKIFNPLSHNIRWKEEVQKDNYLAASIAIGFLTGGLAHLTYGIVKLSKWAWKEYVKWQTPDRPIQANINGEGKIEVQIPLVELVPPLNEDELEELAFYFSNFDNRFKFEAKRDGTLRAEYFVQGPFSVSSTEKENIFKNANYPLQEIKMYGATPGDTVIIEIRNAKTLREFYKQNPQMQ